MLLLDITRKSYTWSPMTLSHLTLRDLGRSKSRSRRYRSIMSHKRAELGHMLLLEINRKVCMGGPFMQLHLTLMAFKG